MLPTDDKSKLVKLLKELVSTSATDDKILHEKLSFINKMIK